MAVLCVEPYYIHDFEVERIWRVSITARRGFYQASHVGDGSLKNKCRTNNVDRPRSNRAMQAGETSKSGCRHSPGGFVGGDNAFTRRMHPGTAVVIHMYMFSGKSSRERGLEAENDVDSRVDCDSPVRNWCKVGQF